MIKKILVSVVIPVYNRENTILHALSSIQKQTYRPIEVILVNDGSLDNTERVIKSYNFHDLFYTLICNKNNMGIGYSRNIWMQNAKWKYIALLDSDDEWTDQNKISKQVNFLEKNAEYAFVWGWWSLEERNLIDTEWPLFKTDYDFRKIALSIYPVHTSTWCFHKKVVNTAWYFWYRKNEDYEFILRIGKYFKCYCLSEIVTRYNNAGFGDRKKNKLKSFLYSLYIIFMYKNEYPFFWKASINRILRVIIKWIYILIWKK